MQEGNHLRLTFRRHADFLGSLGLQSRSGSRCPTCSVKSLAKLQGPGSCSNGRPCLSIQEESRFRCIRSYHCR